MSVQLHAATPHAPATIRLTGRFDFTQHDAFRRAYEAVPAGATVVVDLAQTQYLDSSALGMLLLLRRHAGDAPDNVRLVNPNADVLRVLTIARFDHLFTLVA